MALVDTPDEQQSVPELSFAHDQAIEQVTARLGKHGYAFASSRLYGHKNLSPKALEGFQRSWDELRLDRYMADGGRYRFRRFGVFTVAGEHLLRQPHQPHFQSLDYNRLNGGIERWFEPIRTETAQSSPFVAIVQTVTRLFEQLTPAEERALVWRMEAHQFRITASAAEAGLPTPEGLHRDGVDWVCIVLIRRQNIIGGDSYIASPEGQVLSHAKLSGPLDTLLIDDQRVLHGVTAITPVDQSFNGIRDTLVLTFRRMPRNAERA